MTGEASVATLDATIDGRGVVIGIIDTGIHDAHVTFKGARLTGVDVSLPCDPLPGRTFEVSCYGASDPEDTHGHGSHVAGIAVGRGDGNGQLRGVAPGAKYVEIKAGDAIPFFSPANSTQNPMLAAIKRGFLWVESYNAGRAVDDPARIDVVSCSCGLDPADDRVDLAGAAQRLVDLGIPVVAAAGNCGGCTGRAVASPGIAPGVISVGGIDDRGTPDRADDVGWTGSSRGADGKPEVSAPAVEIESVFHHPALPPNCNCWWNNTGTSMATPHVAGVVGLMLQVDPALTPGEIRQILTTTGYGPRAGDHDPTWGYGAIDAHAAVRASLARQNAPPTAIIQAPAIAFVNESIVMDAYGSADPERRLVAHRWDLGDGTVASGVTVRHAYAAPGNYTVRLEVEDHAGAIAADTRTIDVRPPPPLVAAAAVSPPNGTTATSFAFTAAGSSGHGELAYAWELGDGSNATGPSVAHVYGAAGAYVANLTITDAAGRTARASIAVDVAWAPFTVTIDVAPAAAPDAPHVLMARGAPADATLTWRVGDASSTGPKLERVFAPGDHEVTLTARTPDGREATASTLVRVAARPTQAPTPTPEPAAPTAPQEALPPAPVAVLRVPDVAEVGVAFVVDASGSTGTGLAYTFAFDGVVGATTSEPRLGHTFQVLGQHVVGVVITDAWGRSASAERAILVEAPRAAAAVTTPAPVAGDEALQLAGAQEEALLEGARVDDADGSAPTPAGSWVGLVALALVALRRRLSAR